MTSNDDRGQHGDPGDVPVGSALDGLVRRVHAEIARQGAIVRPGDHDALRAHVVALSPLLTSNEVERAVNRVAQQLFGLGPLSELLEDPTVTEIMANGPGQVWVERDGTISATTIIIDRAGLALIIERIVGPLGLRVDRTAPFVDARLADGSRVHIAVAPLAVDGPYLTIRRFRAEPFQLLDFCSSDIRSLLVQAVQSRQSMLVTGGTGSGKTSLLNALAEHVPTNERIITLEDAAELRLSGEHVVRLESRPPNAEGVGGVSLRSLVRNALRMRPDRLIVGEVRGAEALDMMLAMNTGHAGSMSTCHANSPIDALHRVEAMVLMSDVALPAAIVRQHLRAAIDLVVHVERSIGGAREIEHVLQVGATPADDVMQVCAGRIQPDALAAMVAV